MKKLLSATTVFFYIFVTSILVGNVHAETYPTAPIRMIVAYGAGSATDILARRVSAPLSKNLGQSVVVENKPGAAATIAAEFVSKSDADGYTIFFGTTQSQVVNPHILKDLKYDPLKDFDEVSNIFDVSTVLVVSSALEVNNVEELIEYIKNNPGKASFGTTGFGNVTHLPAAYLAKVAELEMVHVPYTNLGQLIADLVRGEITMMFYPPQGVRSFIEAGTLKPLAWTGVNRSHLFKDIPTMQELGYKDFVFGAWYGLFTPAGVDHKILDKLSDAVAEVVVDPAVVEGTMNDGVDITYMPASDFKNFVENEYNRFGVITTLVEEEN